MKDTCKGYTLVELIVACFIVIVLGTIATAGFTVWLPNYNLKSAARDLYSNMQQVKMAAIKNNGNCTITFTTAPDQYVTTGVTKIVTLSEYGSGVKYQGPGGETYTLGGVLTFNSRGMCTPALFDVYLSNLDNTAYYRVEALSSGVIKFDKWISAEWK